MKTKATCSAFFLSISLRYSYILFRIYIKIYILINILIPLGVGWKIVKKSAKKHINKIGSEVNEKKLLRARTP